MPLPHFINVNYWKKEEIPVYVPMKILSFKEYESKEVMFSKNFFLFYPYGNKEKDKYLSENKSVTFKDNDNFRDILLEQKPKELKYKVFDKEGNLIRELTMYEMEYIENPKNQYEVGLKFKDFEDKYF